jgi:hypothetical protein
MKNAGFDQAKPPENARLSQKTLILTVYYPA